MKKVVWISSALVALAACVGGEKHKGDPAPAKITASTERSGPELGAWGVETGDIDSATQPGDNFYRYASGRWLDTFEIPADFSSYGSFTVLFERSEQRVRAIIEQAQETGTTSAPTERKIGDFYASYLDEEAINAKGLAPLAADFTAIDDATSTDDIARIMFNPEHGATSVISGYVNIDAKQTTRYIFYLTQDGLGLPNKSYYEDQAFADKKEAYRRYIEEILTLAEFDDAAARAEAIFALEARIAKAHWEPAKQRNRDLTYNLKTIDELIAFAPEAPWRIMLEAAGLGAERAFVVREDDAIAETAKILRQTPVDVWRDYLKFHLIRTHADVLPSAFDAATFEFFGKSLRGAQEQRARWKRGVAAVNAALGEAVGQIYVDRYFPASSKAMMEGLVENLRQALDLRLDHLAWMGDDTKKAAHAKLNKFTAKIGYPDIWKDYGDLRIARGDAFGNKRRSDVWAWRDQIGKLGGPIDPTEWFMNPQRVNAYYSPTRNEIVFPAAILQAPFFDPNADPAVNYGGIGAVIGHEISHGFDDQGRKSDGDGLLRDWWTQDDAAAFAKLAERLGKQYSVYEPLPGFTVNPDLTMGENIGDLGGLSMAYDAYKLSLNGQDAPVIDGYTGDQRFFMAWAQVWKRIVRNEHLKNQIASDPHAPAQYRVNGVVRNMDAWYEAFDVQSGDALYLAPEDRVKIW